MLVTSRSALRPPGQVLEVPVLDTEVAPAFLISSISGRGAGPPPSRPPRWLGLVSSGPDKPALAGARWLDGERGEHQRGA